MNGPYPLETIDPATYQRLIDRPGAFGGEVAGHAREILHQVKSRGDAALAEYTKRFDGTDLKSFAVSQEKLQSAWRQADEKLREAIKLASGQIRAFHLPQKSSGYEIKSENGIRVGQLIRPFRRVGLYVPQNLVSTLLMTAVPAQIAGVEEIVICTPPDRNGSVSEAILAAAHHLGIAQIFSLGGPQAIGALAFGTATIPNVELIAGPGNVYVTAAKAQVRDVVAIDMLAGPSEVLLLVEENDGMSAETLFEWVLAELEAQLEHGLGTSAYLVTNDQKLAIKIDASLRMLTKNFNDRRHIAVLYYSDRNSAIEFINRFAPEHLGIWSDEAEKILESVTNAGSVFLGPLSPVALGDYASGTNHTLPTAGQARFSGGLGVQTFVKRISYQKITREGLNDLAPTVMRLAEAEGLSAHARSVQIRLERALHA